MKQEPVAWMTEEALKSLSIPFLSQVTLMTALKASQVDDFNIPLYTYPVKEEYESFDRTASHMAGEYVAHPVKEQLTEEQIIDITKAYFNIHPDAHLSEQFRIKLYELTHFAKAILRKAQEK